MKQVLRFIIFQMIIVLIFGKAVIASAPVAVPNEPVSTGTSTGTISLAGGWTQTNWTASNSLFNLYSSQDKVFARIWDSFNGGRMFLTSDEGINWTQISSADTSIDILSIVMLNSKILAGTWNGFYISTDDGATWNAATPTGIPADIAIWSVVMIDTTLFAGTTGNIFKSLDYGNTWTEVNSGIPAEARITSIVEGMDAVFAGSTGNGIFKTTNGGANWTEINSGLINTQICQLTVMDTKLLAVTLGGVFESDNDGVSWAANTPSIENVNCFVVVNDQLIAGTDDNGIYLSGDNGVTWTSLSAGIPDNTRIWSLSVNNNGIFAGTDKGVWKLPLSEIPTEVKNITGLPKNFTLEQNYPNPFNPTTVISFQLSVYSKTQLKIYDLLGREVAELMDEYKNPGSYQVEFDGLHLSSGIYFYKLQAGEYSTVRKMMLIK